MSLLLRKLCLVNKGVNQSLGRALTLQSTASSQGESPEWPGPGPKAQKETESKVLSLLESIFSKNI